MANLHDNKERIWYKTHAFNLSELIKLSGVGTVSRRSTSQWYSLASVFSRSANFLNEFLSIFWRTDYKKRMDGGSGKFDAKWNICETQRKTNRWN